MGFNLSIYQELYLKAEGSGSFFAKKGAMIADQPRSGKFKYSKRLLGTNGGNIAGQVLNHVARRMTGENLEIMEVEGNGIVYLADKESHVTIIGLEPNGVWNSISVESEDLLAFTEGCKYGVTPVGVGILSQKGLFTSKLTYQSGNPQVAIKTKGNPLVLQVEPNSPVRVDPDALVAWTGKAPMPKLDVNWKTFIGQTSGESYMFEFKEPGQMIIVQAYEREGGISLGIDNDENESYQNPTQQGSTGGIGGFLNSIGNRFGS